MYILLHCVCVYIPYSADSSDYGTTGAEQILQGTGDNYHACTCSMKFTINKVNDASNGVIDASSGIII